MLLRGKSWWGGEPAQGRYRWPPALPAPPHIAVLATEQAVADQPPAQHIATTREKSEIIPSDN